MPLQPDPIEAGRRARAALGYSGIQRKAAAAAVNVSQATLGRILDGSRTETTWEDLWRLADACGLPREWFSADFDRLAEIVSDGPTFVHDAASRRAAAKRFAQATKLAAQRKQQRPDSTAREPRARDDRGRAR